MLILVSYYLDAGRMGDLEGLFITTPKRLEQSIGKRVHWGEVLGKHSDVTDNLDENSFEIKSTDQDFIVKLRDLLGYTISGFNPVDWLEENGYFEEEEDED